MQYNRFNNHMQSHFNLSDMKKKINPNSILQALSFATILLAFAACQKGVSGNANTNSVSPSTIASLQAIAIGTSPEGDSVYIIHTCDAGHRTDSIPFSSLPAAIGTYLNGNYAGYTSYVAYSDKDASDNVSGYVVVIGYNGKPVALKFDASGAFIKVLEQREGDDLEGHGWHHGGIFGDRDHLKHDTIPLGALPAAINSYYSTNYPQDSLVGAIKNRDSSFMVLSVNNGAFVTAFDANGNFIKRVQLQQHHGHANPLAESALPTSVENYLSTTYPNYVFKQAFAVAENQALKGYVVFIDANGTKYAVEFDAQGNFVKAATIR
jgi:hypothetical protein